MEQTIIASGSVVDTRSRLKAVMSLAVSLVPPGPHLPRNGVCYPVDSRSRLEIALYRQHQSAKETATLSGVRAIFNARYQGRSP